MTSRILLCCRECNKEYESTFKYICDECFGPLDVKYNFPTITKSTFHGRENTYWRYFELLPIENKSNIVSLGAGMTPLIKAENLGEKLGLKNLYIKNDSVNPTFSFKDRPAGVAISKAKEFGLSAVGCASTGNLASSTLAHANKCGLDCHVFAPGNLEMAKITQALSYGGNYVSIDGTYDDANRVASQIGDKNGFGIVNINLRSYYVEGSKTFSYEVAEQFDWDVPDHVIVPVGSGAMLNSICKGFEELESLSLINGVDNMHITCAQPDGCSPIVDAFQNNKTDVNPIEKPDTIAKSLAIGDPGDGRYVLQRLNQYNGYAEKADDNEILDAILLLAKTEGIFTEPAGGVAISVLQKMIEQGKLDPNEKIICYITGNGLKATDSIMNVLEKPIAVDADINKISELITNYK